MTTQRPSNQWFWRFVQNLFPVCMPVDEKRISKKKTIWKNLFQKMIKLKINWFNEQLINCISIERSLTKKKKGAPIQNFRRFGFYYLNGFMINPWPNHFITIAWFWFSDEMNCRCHVWNVIMMVPLDVFFLVPCQ